MGTAGLLGNEDGFNTRVNLYIIQYLYFHMDKSEYFTFYKLGSKSKRKSSENIKNVIGISRQRLRRIYNGENYTMPAETSGNLAKMFNISPDYFKGNGDLITIRNITRDDWKCFFHEEYQGSVPKLNLTRTSITEKYKNVQTELGNTANEKYLMEHYDKESALYHIYYYFKEHRTYKPETRLDAFLKDLESLKICDWQELAHDSGELKKYHALLQMHSEYVGACIKIHELKDK